VPDDGETPRERYFELKLLPLLPRGGSPREFAAWSRVLRYYAEWCETQTVLRVLFDDDAPGSWQEAAQLLGRSKQAVHKRWSPSLKTLGLRALAHGLMRSDPPWWSERPKESIDDS